MKMKQPEEGEVVKENIWKGGRGEAGVGVWGAAALAGAAALLALVAATLDSALPRPLTLKDLAANPERFNAELAHDFLINLTSIGPRVSGSYECDVLGVQAAVAGLRAAAAAAGPHNALDIDVHRADGFFNLTFFDGMNNGYRGVVSVVGRLRARGARPTEPALLLNCHIDTVPDSPGASDDGAGCAVVVEAARSLGAAPRPLRRPVLLLLNGAEESIMQGSHSFVTTHRWASAARAFINVEACGAGGREIVFQAGAGWLVSQYGRSAPHPFASSFAQELFEGGLVPADTDYRVFRDFAHIPGLDMAWHADGYVYHTALDVARLAPPAVLQRTGDNVRALAQGILEHEALSQPKQPVGGARAAAPVYFDVAGRAMVVLGARPAALAAAALLAALLLALALEARDHARQYAVEARWWYGAMARAGASAAGALAAGAAAGGGAGAALHAVGARMPYYSHTALLVPLYVLPALLAAAAVLRKGLYASARWEVVWGARRAWAMCRAAQCGGAAAGGLALAAGALAGLRSAFLPACWLAAHLLAYAIAALLPAKYSGVRERAWVWTAVSSLPALQTLYLAAASLRALAPIAGRAGTPPVPPDVGVGVASGLLGVAGAWWCLPLVATARRPAALAVPAAAAAMLAAAWCVYAARGVGGWPYSAARPQRLMVFHVGRTRHEPGAPPLADSFYWVPQLDANTERTLREHVGGVYSESARVCGGWVYCGAPYYLPVRSLVAAGLRAPAPAPPRPRLRVHAHVAPHGPAAATLTLRINGTDVTQTVIIVSVSGARVTLADVGVGRPAPPLPATHPGPENVYFFSLTDPKCQPWTVHLHMQKTDSGDRGDRGGWEGVVQVSVAGHALHGAGRRAPPHAALLAALPPHVAPTGWGVDMHLIRL